MILIANQFNSPFQPLQKCRLDARWIVDNLQMPVIQFATPHRLKRSIQV